MSLRRMVPTVLIALLVVSGCGAANNPTTGGDTTGVTDKEITIGTWQPESGPFKFYGDIQIPGLKAMVNYLNATGDINGRKLKLVIRDGGCTDSQLAVTAGRQLINEDKVFLFADDQCGATVNAITSTLLAGTKIQNFSITGGSRLTGAAPDLSKVGYTYYFSPDTGAQILGPIQWGVKNLNVKKVAFLGGNDAYGADALAATQAAATKYGFQIVDTERVDETATNVSVEMAKIKASGADTVAISCYPQPGGAALTAALQLDYHPNFLAASAVVLYATIQALPPAAFAHLYLPTYGSGSVRPRGSDAEKKFIAMLQPYADTTLNSDNYGGGVILQEVVVPYLKRAGRNLTRESLLAAMHKAPLNGTAYGDINITSNVMNPVVVKQTHVYYYDQNRQIVVNPEVETPAVSY